MRRLLVGLAVVAAALAAVTLLLLPPRPLANAAAPLALTRPVIRGAYHIHSERSDGTGTVDEIAAAAARTGLQFIILTDHGDGTRPPDPPAYRSGVLCLDGVEISTRHGHYVAVGIPEAPYPLGGDARDVIEDVRRLGGVGLAAHPASPKEALQWTAWEAPLDGVEWLNADSEWRDEFWGSLGIMLLTYPLRPVATLGALLDRPAAILERWDALTQSRKVLALAGADAHARLGYRQATDPYDDRVLARVPSYDVSFRAFSNHLILDAPLTGDAPADAAAVLAALGAGRAFTTIDALGAFGGFEVTATSGAQVARPGEYLHVTTPATVEARVSAPSGTTLLLLKDGDVLYETGESTLRLDVGTEPGAYRIEARLPGRSPVPWLLSNPIYVNLAPIHARAMEERHLPVATARAPITTEAWEAEASAESSSRFAVAALADGTPGIAWTFGLAGGARGSQYAAMRFPLGRGLERFDRLQLRVVSDRPRRVWAQLRARGADGGQRWGRSFYVDETLRQIELPFAEFTAFEDGQAATPPLAGIDSLLLVVDTIHTAPASTGRVTFTDLWLAR